VWVWVHTHRNRKTAGIPAGMGKSFDLEPLSWRVWARHFAVMGFSPVPAGLQKPALGIVPTVFAYVVQCTFGRCRLSEENVDGLLFLYGLKMRSDFPIFLADVNDIDCYKHYITMLLLTTISCYLQ